MCRDGLLVKREREIVGKEISRRKHSIKNIIAPRAFRNGYPCMATLSSSVVGQCSVDSRRVGSKGMWVGLRPSNPNL